MLRLVPKSELMAVYRKDSTGASSKSELETTATATVDNNSCSSNTSNNCNSNNNSSSNNNSNSTSSCSGGNNNNNNSSCNSGSNNNCNSANNNNNNSINNNNFLLNNTSPHFMLNNEMKFSPPPHLLSPQSNSSTASVSTLTGSDCFAGTPPSKPAPTRRRVRRRATSSSDPAEQLTEMSVRGLNLFRYACIDEGVYRCLECAKTDIVKTFKNKYSFQRHAFLYHEGCQRKVFPCPVCGKEFSRPDKMKNHMKTVHDCFMPKDCMVPKECLFSPAPPIPFFISPP